VWVAHLVRSFSSSSAHLARAVRFEPSSSKSVVVVARQMTRPEEIQFNNSSREINSIGAGSMEKVNVAEKFKQIREYWKPYIVAELNGQHVKLVKLKGEFIWHHHDNEDEMFLVMKERFRIEFRDRHVWLEEGEFIVVPRGVEHRPVAEEEAHILLFEPASTLNTGNVRDERTVKRLERI